MAKKVYKHLTYDQRCVVENGLNQNLKLNQISTIVGKDPRCIKYEIEHHKYLKVNKRYKNTCGKQNIVKSDSYVINVIQVFVDTVVFLLVIKSVIILLTHQNVKEYIVIQAYVMAVQI